MRRETIGRRVKRLREERGMSQREMTAGLDRVSYAYASRVESGERQPSLRAIRQLADRLGVDPVELATGDASQPCPFCGRS